jgi:CheY-like chemotaxis protein
MAKILVVDDEPSIRVLITEILTRKGHSVVSAANAGEAVEVAAREGPAVALVDLVMPGTGGMTLIMDKLRAMPGLSVIAMSGRIPMGTEAFSSFSDSFGVDCFLGKPFSIEELMKAVDHALAKACAP